MNNRRKLLVLIAVMTSTSTLCAKDHVPWVADIAEAQKLAASRNQLVMLHFTADWCGPCQKLKKNVFSQRSFGHSIGQDFVPVRVDVGVNPQLAKQLNVTAWPTDVIITPTGQELHRMVSPQSDTEYLSVLRQVAWRSKNNAAGPTVAQVGLAPRGSTPPSSSITAPVAQFLKTKFGRGTTAATSAAAFAAKGGAYQTPQVYQQQPQAGSPPRMFQNTAVQNAAVQNAAGQTAAGQTAAGQNAMLQTGATRNGTAQIPTSTNGMMQDANNAVASAAHMTGNAVNSMRADVQRIQSSVTGPMHQAQQTQFQQLQPPQAAQFQPPQAAAPLAMNAPRMNSTPVTHIPTHANGNVGLAAMQMPQGGLTMPAQNGMPMQQPSPGLMQMQMQLQTPTPQTQAANQQANNTFQERMPQVEMRSPISSHGNPTTATGQPATGQAATPSAQQQEWAAIASAAAAEAARVTHEQMQSQARSIEPQTIVNQFVSDSPSTPTTEPAPSAVAETANPALNIAPPQATSDSSPSSAKVADESTLAEQPAISSLNAAQSPSESHVQQASMAPEASSTPPSAASPNKLTVAIDGYCPVGLFESNEWIIGDKRWGARHRGNIYLFHSAAAQQQFLSDPDRYSPLLAGYDPVVFKDQRQYVTGTRTHGIRFQDRIVLFSSEESLNKFSSNPDRYLTSVQQAMQSAKTYR